MENKIEIVGEEENLQLAENEYVEEEKNEPNEFENKRTLLKKQKL